MNADEWERCIDPQAMLEWLTSGSMTPESLPHPFQYTERKLRLWTCAMSRLMVQPSAQADIADIEDAADDPDTVWENLTGGYWCAERDIARGAGELLCGFLTGWRAMGETVLEPRSSALIETSGPLAASILRDLIYNPFRPRPTLPPLTPDIRALAQATYSERLGPRKCDACGGDGYAGRLADDDEHACAGCGRPAGVYGHFTERSKAMECPKCERCHGSGRIDDGTLDNARLAVLSDSLEEVGCGDELLAHLRAPGARYRGDWAVDMVLGKE
jgi:hypothetical protein